MSQHSSTPDKTQVITPAMPMILLDRQPSPDVAPRNIPKRGIPQYLNENVPQDYRSTLAKITELEEKLEVERNYKHFLEALASAAHISLEEK